MAPSYPTKQLGFSDDRRRGGYSGGGEAYQSYRPQDRDRGRDRDIPRSGDRSLSRRESDPRDYRDDRDRSRDRDRDRAKTRDETWSLDLQLNTNIPTGPRIPTSSAKSPPMSTRGTGPSSLRSSVTTPNATIAQTSQTCPYTGPTAKDPKLQPLVKQIWDWENVIRKRTIVSAQRDKKLREIHERERSMESIAGNRNDNSSILEVQQRLRDHDKKEWNELDRIFKSFDKPYAEYLESIATVIHSTTMQTSPNATSTQPLDSSIMATLEKKMEETCNTKVTALEKKIEEKFDAKVATLEEKMEEDLCIKTAGLEEDLAKAQKEIEKLKSARTQAEENVKELHSNLCKALKTITEIDQKTGASAAKLLSSCAALEVRQNQLQDDNGKVQNEVTALKGRVSKVSQEATRREAEVDKKMATIRTTCSTKASTSNLDDVKSETSADLTELKRQAKIHEDQLVALNSAKPPPFLVDVNDKLKTLVSEVAAIQHLRKDVDAVQRHTATLESRLRSLDIPALLNMLEEWLSSGIAQKVPRHDNDIEHLRQEINKLKGQGGRLVQEPTPPVPDDGLRTEMRKEIQDGNRQKTEEINQLRKTLKTNMDKLFAWVKDLLEKQGRQFAVRLDDLEARTETLESNSNRSPEVQNPQAENQAQNQTGVMTDVQFDARIQAMKDELPSLLAEQVTKDVAVLCNAQLEGFRRELADYRGRVERTSFELSVVNNQLSHINTKPMWDQVCGQVDQNYSMFGPRIDVNVKKLKQLEEKLALLIDRVAPVPPKRPGSPLGGPSSSENGSKRQRVDSNAALHRIGSFGDLRPGGN
ncbi:hypothetical protein PG994_001222 [Apiospora phragmitis]|uniref:Uncharacterized protein n=1 Tax=Apiospora phragmitis TaxID=2905665 RepID=A0ABR1WSY8_9PEZI